MQNKNRVDFCNNISPVEFADKMFKNTAEDGTLYLDKWYDVDCEDCHTYNDFVTSIKWTAEDLEYVISEYNKLFKELKVIGEHLIEIDGTYATATEILPDELVASYCIFVAPFEAKNKQELNAEVIGRVSEGICGYKLIRHSQRLSRLAAIGAPEIIIYNEARKVMACLALHMFGEKIELL